MLLFCTDKHLSDCRAVMPFMTADNTEGWTDKRISASRKIIRDLKTWYLNESGKRNVSADELPFSDLYLRSGYHYVSTETAVILTGERVLVDPYHTEGGESGEIYRRSGESLSQTALPSVDFTADGWEICENQLRELSVYYALFLIYQYAMNDTETADGYERQADRFLKMYNDEWERLMSVGIQYDWDESGVIEADEKAPTGAASSKINMAVW